MKAVQVRDAPALDALRVMQLTLPDLINQADPEAAESLNGRMALLDMIEKAHEISYSQRIVIIREFEKRSLWKYLTDPMVGEAFPHLTAWLSSGFVGCRRVSFEAKRDGALLAEMDATQLLGVPKGSLKVLIGVSTSVRNLPDVLEAAKAGDDALLEKLEKDHPEQHLTARKRLIFSPGRSEAKVIEAWIAYALEHDLAGTKEEALVRACECALDQALLDEELAAMPTEEVPA